MPNFESPLGNKNFNGPSMKEFDIPDNTGYVPQQAAHYHPPVINENSIKNFQNKLEQSFQDKEQFEAEERAYAARKGIKEKVSDSARKRIEMLLGMSQTTREVNIENNIFVLRTLKAKEMREAMMAAFDFDGTVQAPYEMRKQLLGRALTHIAGIEIEQFIGTSTLDGKMAFIDELDDNLLNRLYDEYVKLSNTAKEKYSIKNPEDMKEVVEDIKKS